MSIYITSGRPAAPPPIDPGALCWSTSTDAPTVTTETAPDPIYAALLHGRAANLTPRRLAAAQARAVYAAENSMTVEECRAAIAALAAIRAAIANR